MSPPESEHGRTDLLEQYKFYAGTSSEVSNRRLKTNRFYVSLLSGILVAFPFVLDLDNLTPFRLVVMLTIGFVGVVIAVVWFFNIWSYKQLNSGKYEVIHDMEEELPYACFTREWEILGEGRHFQKYVTHWKVERMVPWLVAIPYLVLVVFSASRLI